jgi:dihydroxyacetone kinase-like predicted kinase
MREQHTEQVISSYNSQSGTGKADKTRRKYGFVAVCAGEGITAVFKDLGVDALIEGGQTMNPSTEDILKKIGETPAETVFVLPNNKNIIMAAEQCVPLSEKRVVVLPSKTGPQGMAALLGFDAALELEQNREAMIAAMSSVTTGQITYAARESVFDGQEISEGDHLALIDGKLSFIHRDLGKALDYMVAAVNKENLAYISIFYGEGVDAAGARSVSDMFSKAYPQAEITLINGGQPVYYYLISAE